MGSYLLARDPVMESENVFSFCGSGTSASHANAANSSRRPFRTASIKSASPWLVKYWKRGCLAILLAHKQKRHERREKSHARGKFKDSKSTNALSLSPFARLPIWSWF